MKVITNFKSILFYLILSLVCFSCQTSLKNEIPSGYAAFDWFEYQGYNPVYDSIEAGTDEYLNPVLAGFYPDPSMVRVGEDYYLVTSSFSFFPGIPIFHSKDLVNWTQIGHVLDRPSQLNLDGLRISNGAFAPVIRYDNGIFYVINTIAYGINNFIVTATNPAGPWSDPVLLPFDGIDPSLFFDEDAKTYIVNNGPPEEKPLYEGHRAIWMQEFDKDKLELIGKRKVIVNGGVDMSKKPIWIEAPHIFKINDFYYLSAAEGGTSTDHSQVIFRSKDVWGPYIPRKQNPILTQRHLNPDRPNPVTCTGHMDMLETQTGEWWGVFLGCTPYEGDYYNTGRQTFLLPVKWENDWPTILEGDALVPLVHIKPDLPKQHLASVPMNGNFTYRDEFADTSLSMIYNMIRTPREKWHYIEKNKLFIMARDEAIDDKLQPSFIGRRQQHNYCSASLALQCNLQNPGDKAGIVAFQNEIHYYFMGLTLKNKGISIILEKGSPDGSIEITSNEIDLENNASIYLKIEARGKYYDFYYALQSDDWKLLKADLDGKLLSTYVAGGFVGTYYGMYAYSKYNK